MNSLSSALMQLRSQ